MKKFIVGLLICSYLNCLNSCLAASELYLIKNTTQDALLKNIKDTLYLKNYSIKEQNQPYSVYAKSNKNSEDYVSFVLQQNGEDVYYFLDSNKSTKTFTKTALVDIPKNDIVVIENTTYISIFESIADRNKNGVKPEYKFEEEIPLNLVTPGNLQVTGLQNQNSQEYAQSQVLQGYVTQLNKGTKFDVYLQHGIDTATAAVGDEVVAVLKSDLLAKGGVVAPQGSILYGYLVKANSASYGSRNGAVTIMFDKLVLPDSRVYDIAAQKVEFKVTNEGKVMRTSKKVATAALVGGLVGLGLAALSSGSDSGRGLAKGAMIGAGVAGASSLLYNTFEAGIDAEIPSYTDIEIVLDKPVNVTVGN